jgi:DNA helicase-2/ATP-dependent DNA helicase PcrA
MREICQYLSVYKISMPQYQRFYRELKKRFNAAQIKEFTRVNTHLLLQDTMENLKQIQFQSLPDPSNIANYQAPDFSWCSKEQLEAIMSDKPLNLVQAGAGTGKSTTIKARIEHLLSLGVKANDILVLSFTNAAAENMKAKAPNIQSMTIAKMIDTIYSLNHPTHKLASAASRKGEGATFTNSLALYFDTNPLAKTLKPLRTFTATR